MTDITETQVDEIFEETIQEAFDELMSDYELDSTMSIEDMLYEMFASGFEVAVETLNDDDDEDEDEE